MGTDSLSVSVVVSDVDRDSVRDCVCVPVSVADSYDSVRSSVNERLSDLVPSLESVALLVWVASFVGVVETVSVGLSDTVSVVSSVDESENDFDGVEVLVGPKGLMAAAPSKATIMKSSKTHRSVAFVASAEGALRRPATLWWHARRVSTGGKGSSGWQVQAMTTRSFVCVPIVALLICFCCVVHKVQLQTTET